jgi:hypothetical protein
MSALAARFLRRAKTRTNPVFAPDRLQVVLHDDPDRYQRILEDPDSLDLLIWNIFGSLATHSDREWLAHRLQAFGGSGVRAPVRLALWTGRDREPRLEPSPGYVAAVRERIEAAGGGEAELREFAGPIEVPVRMQHRGGGISSIRLTLAPGPAGGTLTPSVIPGEFDLQGAAPVLMELEVEFLGEPFPVPPIPAVPERLRGRAPAAGRVPASPHAPPGFPTDAGTPSRRLDHDPETPRCL